MYGKLKDHLAKELAAIEEAGLFKRERIITSEQGAEITVNGRKVLNFCANNYLGLSSDPEVVKAAHDTLDSHGYGMSSVRFICGTQDIHKELERKLAVFHGTEDTILYAACFDANGGVFEPLFGQEDAIISDALNHASIIDGVRLCKAMRYRYANNDMADLELQLKTARADGANNIIIVTDGVFSMDGIVADLKGICDLADKYEALVMVDECHAAGFIGKTGRGSVEHCGVTGRVDIITGTLGKALGGAMGGYTTGRKEIIEMLRQRSRPYLFSNSLTPAIVGASIKVIDVLSSSTALRDRLERNVDRFRRGIEALGFKTRGAGAAIVPVMLGDAKLSQVMADKLLDEGIYVIGFFFPVVPKDTARIRVQLSAAHTDEQIDRALAAFGKVGKELGVI
ncbi:MAG: glycine C-acetyltransferase [Flavobacteriales bacterium]|nr:glycine C-acetyltransferase [Flavobacteriales bacterium]